MVTNLRLLLVVFDFARVFLIGRAIAQSPVDCNELCVRNRGYGSLRTSPDLEFLEATLKD